MEQQAPPPRPAAPRARMLKGPLDLINDEYRALVAGYGDAQDDVANFFACLGERSPP